MHNKSLPSIVFSTEIIKVAFSARDWPLCSVELKSNMYAARDSETCVRRSNLQNNITPVKVCDQLSDYNVYYFLEPR